MKVKFCDRCERPIDESKVFAEMNIDISFPDNSSGMISHDSRDADLCSECLAEFLNFLLNRNKQIGGQKNEESD